MGSSGRVLSLFLIVAVSSVVSIPLADYPIFKRTMAEMEEVQAQVRGNPAALEGDKLLPKGGMADPLPNPDAERASEEKSNAAAEAVQVQAKAQAKMPTANRYDATPVDAAKPAGSSHDVAGTSATAANPNTTSGNLRAGATPVERKSSKGEMDVKGTTVPVAVSQETDKQPAPNESHATKGDAKEVKGGVALAESKASDHAEVDAGTTGEATSHSESEGIVKTSSKAMSGSNASATKVESAPKADARGGDGSVKASDSPVPKGTDADQSTAQEQEQAHVTVEQMPMAVAEGHASAASVGQTHTQKQKPFSGKHKDTTPPALMENGDDSAMRKMPAAAWSNTSLMIFTTIVVVVFGYAYLYFFKFCVHGKRGVDALPFVDTFRGCFGMKSSKSADDEVTERYY